MAGLFEELKRRNVIKVGAAYVVLSWLLAQVADLAADTFSAPDWVMKMLVTLLALGLPLALLFAWAFELTPEGLKKEKDVDRSKSITRETGRKLDYTIIAVLLLALGYFAWDKFVRQAPGDRVPETAQQVMDEASSVTGEPAADQEIPAPAEAALPPISAKSIAVLPFVNMSSDPEQEYFSDGISEEILNALARVSELKVAGRTSSFAFKGQNQDLKAIGQALRVSHILEGSVRKSGNQLRITAQLINVDDGYHLWSETYDREMTDVFAIQDEISNAILAQLKAKLLGGEQLASTQADPAAYAQYLLAKQRIYERSQASLELAAELLKQAIEIDPGFAAAHAQLGIATILLSSEQYGELPNEQAYELGRQHLEKALALDPQQAEALAGMGLYWGDKPGQLDVALGWLQKSLDADPNQANASNWMANYLRASGRLQEALALREKDFARDPLYMPVFSNLVQLYLATNRADKAERIIQDLEPYLHDDANMMMTRGTLYQVTGQWAKADRAFRQAYEMEPKNFVNNIWYCLTLTATAQNQSCADLGDTPVAVLALSRMGRPEEGLILGYKAVAGGQYPGWLFQALVENGRYGELVEFVESRWASLAAFENDFGETNGWGASAMISIAEAYAHTGNDEKFAEAVERAQATNNLQLNQGVDNGSLSLSRAHLAAVAGNPSEAIDLLERAFSQGLLIDLATPGTWPAFQPLRGDPRFEALREKLIGRLNMERNELQLEPVTT